MRGYCEGCQSERQGEDDEYGVECCPDCGSDLLMELHVETEFVEFGDWLDED